MSVFPQHYILLYAFLTLHFQNLTDQITFPILYSKPIIKCNLPWEKLILVLYHLIVHFELHILILTTNTLINQLVVINEDDQSLMKVVKFQLRDFLIYRQIEILLFSGCHQDIQIFNEGIEPDAQVINNLSTGFSSLSALP